MCMNCHTAPHMTHVHGKTMGNRQEWLRECERQCSRHPREGWSMDGSVEGRGEQLRQQGHQGHWQEAHTHTQRSEHSLCNIM